MGHGGAGAHRELAEPRSPGTALRKGLAIHIHALRDIDLIDVLVEGIIRIQTRMQMVVIDEWAHLAHDLDHLPGVRGVSARAGLE